METIAMVAAAAAGIAAVYLAVSAFQQSGSVKKIGGDNSATQHMAALSAAAGWAGKDLTPEMLKGFEDFRAMAMGRLYPLPKVNGQNDA